jgi:hypothetical protein
MKYWISVFILFFGFHNVKAQIVEDSTLAQMIADSCPQCIIGDSLTAAAQSITDLELTQTNNDEINSTKGLDYFTGLTQFKLTVHNIYLYDGTLPPNLKRFYFTSLDSNPTWLGQVHFNEGLEFLHLDGIISEGLDFFPFSLKILEFGSVEDEGKYFPCLPPGLDSCKNLVSQKLFIPNKPKNCTFDGNLAINPYQYYQNCYDDNIRVNVLAYHDKNCNGHKDNFENYINGTTFTVKPLDITITDNENAFYADSNQTLIFHLESTTFKIYPNGEDFIFHTDSLLNHAQTVIIPLCERTGEYSILQGNIYYDRNKNLLKDSTENYVSGIKLLVQPTNEKITTTGSGQFIFKGDTSTAISMDLALPSSITYRLAQGAIHATTPATFLTTDTLGDIPIWDKLKDYDATIAIIDIGSSAKNSNKRHQTTISNTGLNDLTGTVTWTLKNWEYTNFYDFSIAPDEVLKSGKDITLLFNNFSISSGQSRTIVFYGSIIQETGTEITENVRFEAQSSIDITDKITYIVGAPHDPNFIEVDMNRISQKFINQDGKLNYSIHFQNIGTASAKKVTIYNYASSLVDLEQLKITGLSDIPTLDIYNVGSDKYLLIWTFENINLPNAATDSIGSMGYISYQVGFTDKIAPKDSISNRAEIVFDTESPIHTNIARTRFYCPQMDGLHFAQPIVDFFKCADGVASFNVNYDPKYLPLTGQWQDQDENSLDNRIFNTAGDFTYVLSDEALCTESFQIRLQKPDSIQYTYERTDSLLHLLVSGGTSPYTITWENENSTGEYLWLGKNGTYKFTITDFNGCEKKGSIEISTLTTDEEPIKMLKIYPQPAKDILYLTLPNESIFKYSIINSSGQTSQNQQSRFARSIDIHTLPSGAYTLLISQGDQNYVARFIKK